MRAPGKEELAIARLVRPNDRYLLGKQVRLIDQNQQQLGVVTFDDAVARARAANLDLMEVAGQAIPPVCRILDFGKFRYEESRKQRDAKKKQVHVKLKEVKFHPNINDNDYEVKRNHILDFLGKGHKVKVSMFFRGRENAHADIGMKVLERLLQDIATVGRPESPPRRMGSQIATVLTPEAKKP